MDFESSDLMKKIKERLSSNKINFKNTVQYCPLLNKKHTNMIKILKNKTINTNNLKADNNLFLQEILGKNIIIETPTPKRIFSCKNSKLIKNKISEVEKIINNGNGTLEDKNKDKLNDKIDDELNFYTNEIQDNFFKTDNNIETYNFEEIRSKNYDGI